MQNKVPALHSAPISSLRCNITPTDMEEKILIISNQDSEECWQECMEVGLFAYWNGLPVKINKVSKWLEDFCGDQVSISHYLDRLLYIISTNKNVKTEFLDNPVYFFNGHAIKFFDWKPNCCEENLDFSIPSWFSINPIPPELKDINIIKKIGKSMGSLIGMDNSYDRSNNIKLLIKCDVNKTELKPIKIITNRSIYRLHFQKYEGGITEIIMLDDDRKDNFDIMFVSSDLEEFYPKNSHKKRMEE